MPVEKLKATLFNRIGAAAEKAYGQRPRVGHLRGTSLKFDSDGDTLS